MSPPKPNKLTRTGSLVNPPGITPVGTNTAGPEKRRMSTARRSSNGSSNSRRSSEEFNASPGSASNWVHLPVSTCKKCKKPRAQRSLSIVPEGSVPETAAVNANVATESKQTVFTPNYISSIFSDLDSRNETLSQNDQRKLQKAHSMANSVMSFPNTNPAKVETLQIVGGNLQEMQAKYNNKLKTSAKQLIIISKLEKELKHEKEKHRRATAMIKEHMLDDIPVPIMNTRKINELTKEMEKLKNDGDLNRSRLLGQIVSLAKKEKAAMGALSNMKTMAVTKNKNVTEMKRKLKDYATAVETLTEQLKKKQTLVVRRRKPALQRKIKPVTLPLTVSKPKTNTATAVKSKTTTAVKPKTNTVVKTVTNEHIRKIVKQETNGRVPTTPPGITKTNIERLLQPFKQPVSVKFAPTISVKGGSAKATGGSLEQVQIQHKSPTDKKKKKPLKLTRGPATARKQESAKFRNAIISKLRSPVAAKRREALYSLRTPTTGQRKKHVIELIDRVLRRMKVRADVEKKLIKFYESLSERHIKQLFGGRTKEEVKTILKKQVSYFSKKR